MIDDTKVLQIASEIDRFGVSNDERLKLMFQLALRLENNEHVKMITDVIKECQIDADASKSVIIRDNT